MDDMETADIIMALDEPNEMKQYGRYVKNFNQTVWDQHCMRVVEKGNIAKVLFRHKSACMVNTRHAYEMYYMVKNRLLSLKLT